MRVLICGGRDYHDRAACWHYLDNFGPPEITEVISGMAKGADTLAAEWAVRFGFTLHQFPANWDAHGKSAGMIRNRQMLVEGKPDVVIAFPGGKGTQNMIELAKKAGVKVVEVGK